MSVVLMVNLWCKVHPKLMITEKRGHGNGLLCFIISFVETSYWIKQISNSIMALIINENGGMNLYAKTNIVSNVVILNDIF